MGFLQVICRNKARGTRGERRALLGVSPWSAQGFGDAPCIGAGLQPGSHPRIGERLHLLQANSTASVSRTFIFLSLRPGRRKGTELARQRDWLTGAAVQALSL